MTYLSSHLSFCVFLFTYPSKLRLHLCHVHASYLSLPISCRLAMAIYGCGYCRESFSSVSELKRHVEQEKRKQEYSVTHTCAFCSEARETVAEIKEHVQRCHHANPFQCNGCSTVCPTLAALQRHTRSHIAFQCDYCEKAFNQKHHLLVHMRTHTGEKPFQCRHCDRKFSQRTHLKAHITTHTGEKPFQCGQCNWKFCNQMSQRNAIGSPC